jgi:hypothetical protein
MADAAINVMSSSGLSSSSSLSSSSTSPDFHHHHNHHQHYHHHQQQQQHRLHHPQGGGVCRTDADAATLSSVNSDGSRKEQHAQQFVGMHVEPLAVVLPQFDPRDSLVAASQFATL